MKNIIWVALTIAVACGIAGVIILKHPLTPEVATPTAKAERQPDPARTGDEVRPPAPLAEAPPTVAQVPAPLTASVDPQDAPLPKTARADPKAPGASAPARGGGSAREPLHDPLAREALAFVGLDPSAEEYWYAAINDSALSAHERQDLIEDLNEDGLSDPKHPVLGDLPLILNRIQLIELATPYAMDQVNAEAFQEAYKDLVNLAGVAMGSGERVR
jgi:hypothetical protein